MLVLVPLILTLGSCCAVNRQRVDSAKFEKLPDTFSSKFYRWLAGCTPATRKRAFYGRYCGPSDQGGRPVDALDAACRWHDIAYWQARSREELTEADRKFIEDLGKLDEDLLCPRAREFRRSAIKWFNSPACKVIGKPLLPGADPVAERVRFARPSRRGGR